MNPVELDHVSSPSMTVSGSGEYIALRMRPRMPMPTPTGIDSASSEQQKADRGTDHDDRPLRTCGGSAC